MRRLFMMDVDGAAAIPTSEGTCYIGLPPEAAELVGQLSREGRIALDLNLNVKARVVQGIYPVRLPPPRQPSADRSEEHTSELQSPCNLVCRLLLEKKKKLQNYHKHIQ